MNEEKLKCFNNRNLEPFLESIKNTEKRIFTYTTNACLRLNYYKIP